MPESTNLQRGASNRLGLIMIAASLAAITLIVGALLWQQRDAQEQQIRAQGHGLARMLAGLPIEQLVAGNEQQGLLRTIFQSQNDPYFAYAAIVTADNSPLVSVSTPGLTVPQGSVSGQPGNWLQERNLSGSHGEQFIEFMVQLPTTSAPPRYLRLGYTVPTVGLSIEQLPFLASLALIVFLLTPLFYLLVRSETQPLRAASEQIARIVDSEEFRHVELKPNDDLKGFMSQFSRLVETAQQRIRLLETEKEQLATSKQLISYSKARIENVLEAIPEAVLILDKSGQISFANSRIEAMLGVSREEVLNSGLSSWCHNLELYDVISGYCDNSTAGYLADTVRLDLGTRSPNCLSIKAYPLFTPTEDTSIYGTLIVLRDVSREAAVFRQQGEFVSHVAHELKTPLNNLSLYSESLLDDSDDEEQRVEAANIIHDEVGRLCSLIDNLLNITQIELGEVSINRQRLRLGEFLDDAIKVAARSERADKLKFDLDLPPEPGSIMADKELLRVAVNNLLSNAVKYSKPGGTVSLVCEENEQTIRITVSDEGYGIAEDELDNIFNRFFRSERDDIRAVPGHGLGLALAREIVQLHHGTLTVDSKLGQGSSFVIELWKEAGLLKQAI